MAKEEERHMENNTKDEQTRQTISISIGGGGGGGIGGLVVLGGALAIARLVATFFTINEIREGRHVNMENDCFTKDDDDEGTAQRQGSSDETSKTMPAQIEPYQMVIIQSNPIQSNSILSYPVISLPSYDHSS
ncbi:unnamed protein product [Prunus armeniaca]|uniref:Uncharacterized protein n=1 Tax=Prunus armeniaca TaxID=36596 RepID=A0A6J5YF49_PRUAR|nr:unnamed protein product [Prunus armeniaca]